MQLYGYQKLGAQFLASRQRALLADGMGLGKSRFSSPKNRFRLLYLAQDPTTAVAETIVRDRFEGASERLLLAEEFDI